MLAYFSSLREAASSAAAPASRADPVTKTQTKTQPRGRWQLRPSTMTCRSAMGRVSDHRQVSSRVCAEQPWWLFCHGSSGWGKTSSNQVIDSMVPSRPARCFLQTKLWSTLLLLLYYYYYMYYMGLLYVVIYFCLRDEHATRNNFPPTRILTALQRRRGNIGKKLTCVRISVSDCYWVVYFSFAYLPINVKNFVHRHRIYKYGFVYSRDVISFYTNRTLMRLNLHIIALPTIGRGLPVCSCRKMWLSQLNSTENYGRRCLTPPSPHRNYILS